MNIYRPNAFQIYMVAAALALNKSLRFGSGVSGAVIGPYFGLSSTPWYRSGTPWNHWFDSPIEIRWKPLFRVRGPQELRHGPTLSLPQFLILNLLSCVILDIHTLQLICLFVLHKHFEMLSKKNDHRFPKSRNF